MSANILILEDNRANLELMLYLLRAFGYSPEAATNGLEGVAAAQSGNHDLIICDLQMPGIDGYEVAKRLKQDPRTKRIPLVAVTAFAMVGDRDKVLDAGFDGYIPKPITPELFVGQVEKFLNGVPVKQPAGEQVSAQKTSGGHRTKASILVVDNNSVNLQLARSMLEPLGYRVITSLGITDALSTLKRERPDIILSDVHMSDGNGFDFIKTVKADPELAPIPFVFISSTYTEPDHEHKARSLGALRFLVRPIETSKFLAEIEACLRDREKR